MFERYSELARRSVFFARYEASATSTGYIETEHLLLGLLREDRNLRGKLPEGAVEQIRTQVEQRFPAAAQKIPTSVDLPISHELKRALAYGAEECERLGQKTIDCGHLVLGLLRTEKCGAAEILRGQGIGLEGYREYLSRPEGVKGRRGDRTGLPREEEAVAPAAGEAGERNEPNPPSSRAAGRKLDALVDDAARYLDHYSGADSLRRLKRHAWTRGEALGHLIDWAATHQQWFARALTESKLVAAGYPQEEWLAAQQYQTVRWEDLVDLWVCENRLLAHVLRNADEEKLNAPCRIGMAEAIPLGKLMDRYVEHCEDVMGEILTCG